MPGFKDLLGGGRPLTPLDEETVALLSDPAMLARVEELEEALHAFKRQLGQEFLDGLSRALRARIEDAKLSWTYMEEVRVETFVGLRPTGALAHDERAFWPVMNFATSPGIPFSAPWVGVATTPRSSAQLKQRVFDLVGDFFQNPKQAGPASWWVQWGWCPDWPDATRPRNLVYLIGPEREKLVERIADWLVSLTPVIEEALRPGAGDLW